VLVRAGTGVVVGEGATIVAVPAGVEVGVTRVALALGVALAARPDVPVGLAAGELVGAGVGVGVPDAVADGVPEPAKPSAGSRRTSRTYGPPSPEYPPTWR
jgi:hypothetical protein